MEGEITCPDCGKTIAPKGSIQEALRCRCAEAMQPKTSVATVPSRPRISVPIPTPAAASGSVDEARADANGSGDDLASMPVSTEKKCYVCGADLAGRVRLKDKLGRYWCKECSAADERAKKREDELRCADCSRVFPAAKLKYFQTDRVCSTCYKEREKQLEKKIVKANAEKVHKTHEFKQLKWLAIAAIGMIVIAMIFRMIW